MSEWLLKYFYHTIKLVAYIRDIEMVQPHANVFKVQKANLVLMKTLWLNNSRWEWITISKIFHLSSISFLSFSTLLLLLTFTYLYFSFCSRSAFTSFWNISSLHLFQIVLWNLSFILSRSNYFILFYLYFYPSFYLKIIYLFLKSRKFCKR